MLRNYNGQRVIIATAEVTFVGRVASTSRQTITLVEASDITEPKSPLPIDGRLLVPLGQILFVQVP